MLPTTEQRLQELEDEVHAMANLAVLDAETFKRLNTLHGNLVCNKPELLTAFHDALDRIWTDEFIKDTEPIDMAIAYKTRQFLTKDVDSPYCIFTNMDAYRDFKCWLFKYKEAGITLFKWICSLIPAVIFPYTDLFEACLVHIIQTADADYFAVFDATSFLFVYSNIRELMVRAIGTVLLSYSDVSVDALGHIVTITQMLYHVYPLRHTWVGFHYNDVKEAMFNLQYKKKFLKEQEGYDGCIGEIAFRATFELIERSRDKTSPTVRNDLMKRFLFPRYTERFLEESYDELVAGGGEDTGYIIHQFIAGTYKRRASPPHTPKHRRRIEVRTPDTVIV
jgi:hypothetical protein